MARTAVVTGSASGLGRATKALLEARGERVIGVDLRDADVTVDLTTEGGRAQLVEEVTARSEGSLDAIYAIAGSAQPVPLTAAVNFFGAVATLEGLRPLLEGSPAPRAVTVTSMAALHGVDDELVAAMTAGDEPRAMARAEALAAGTSGEGYLIYSSSKRALAQWVRRSAPSPAWAGASIPLNAVAPGVVVTPMTQDLIATEEAKASLLELVPMPLNGIAEAPAVAHLLGWLGSVENSHLCGQIIYIDGGSDAVMRGDAIW